VTTPCAALVCVECGREQAVGERGWRAFLTVDEDEPAEAVVYCPDADQPPVLVVEDMPGTGTSAAG
jgi:hypothetical protein